MSMKYLHLPDEEQRECIRQAVNSSRESVKRDVQQLIEWLEKNSHLPNLKDEDILAHCLLNCKNSLERTKKQIEIYFTTKALMPEIFLNRDPFDEELEKTQKLGMYVPLPKLTPDGYRVIILYLSDEIKKLKNFSSINPFLKLTQMTVDILGKYDYPKGMIVIHDGKNYTFPFVTAFSSDLNKLIVLTQKAIPVRYNKLYFCNMGAAGEVFLTIGKTLIKKHLANRIIVLKHQSDICKVLPKSIIPRDYGGEEFHLEELKDKWFDEIKHHHEYLKKTEEYIADLSKIPKEIGLTDLSGTTGSFRRICLD